MRKILILLSAILILSTTSHTFAQETERPKSEVDKQIEKAKEHGEVVLTRCLENCGENAITGGVETGRVLELVTPAYPPLARAAHASGSVVVQLLIDGDGTVVAAAAVSGHPLLYGASVEAARKTTFSPTKLDGKPVKVTGVITYNFMNQ